ncbi:exopolysaccharide biosynthesis polyprenyl glycosylphosphotransferase [Nakamurella sp. YIM 132087]|uniref:Exopolysaccharide biosynthesis polyprenyl glycosylphosphotransferase n=1 Tax=Nakamurella alba TaxID=2665158 RepID=A0A7K1FNW7_9ACTN|nr:exopolysaccharide biosynthesis polyprenyl glycosylphosphotransferase [Nakamurella alba]
MDPGEGAAGYLRRVVIGDVVVVAAAVAAGAVFRFGLEQARLSSTGAFRTWSYAAVGVAIGIAWLLSLAMNGTWRREPPAPDAIDLRKVVRSTLVLFAVVTAVDYALNIQVARGFLFVTLPLGLLGMVGLRLYWRHWMRRRWARGLDLIETLVVGGRISAVTLADQFRRASAWGYRVCGLCVHGGGRRDLEDGGAGSDHATLGGFPVLGALEDVQAAVAASGASTVVIASTDGFGSAHVRKLSWALEGTGVRLVLAPSMHDVAGQRIRLRPVAGIPLMHVSQASFHGPKLVAKTAVDLIGAFIGLVLLSPVMIALAVAVRSGDGGPVFFRQERVGLDGRTFRMWKFRSMCVDAEARLAALRASSDGNDMLFKMKDDPRVTRIGRVMRRYSLDEIPQLFNVLAGQMSLVGPRPPLVSEVAQYDDDVSRRLMVKPGMTGLWQVSGRSDLSWAESVRLDLYYVENWSPMSDLVIMAQTVRVMLSSRGAY